MALSQTARFTLSKCDRCGKSTKAMQNGVADLYVLPHEWGAPLADQGNFCQRCIGRDPREGWLIWFALNRPEAMRVSSSGRQQTIYVVQASCGDYEEHTTWNVAAFTNEIAASVFAAKAYQRASELYTHYGEIVRDFERYREAQALIEQNQYDPGMSTLSSVTTYSISALILND